jgi:hypothetical protein
LYRRVSRRFQRAELPSPSRATLKRKGEISQKYYSCSALFTDGTVHRKYWSRSGQFTVGTVHGEYCAHSGLFMTGTVHDRYYSRDDVPPSPSFLSYIKRGEGMARGNPRHNPSRHLSSCAGLGEALQDFCSTTITMSSCCWDSRRIYHICYPAGTRKGHRHHQPYVCPSTEVLPVCGTGGIVFAILRSASERLHHP